MQELLTASRDLAKQLEHYYNRTQSMDALVKESKVPDLIKELLFTVSITESYHPMVEVITRFDVNMT